MARNGADHEEQVEEVLGLFMQEIRAGRYPSVESLAQAHPHIADRIRSLIPSLITLEKLSTDLDAEKRLQSRQERSA